MFTRILLVGIIIISSGCAREIDATEQAQIEKVAASGTRLVRGDFFEFKNGCFAMNIVEMPFEGFAWITTAPGASSVALMGIDLVRYGARLVPKERNEEALHAWVLQKAANTHDCIFKEVK